MFPFSSKLGKSTPRKMQPWLRLTPVLTPRVPSSLSTRVSLDDNADSASPSTRLVDKSAENLEAKAATVRPEHVKLDGEVGIVGNWCRSGLCPPWTSLHTREPRQRQARKLP